jgi:hypothetical protein
MALPAAVTAVKGLSKVLANINRAVKKIGGANLAGMYAAGLQVQREAMRRVPVEYGVLRASAYTQKVNGGKDVEVGFTAEYSVYVHENLEQKLKGQPRPSGKGVYWGPAGEPKFLERALREVDVAGIVAGYVKKAIR